MLVERPVSAPGQGSGTIALSVVLKQPLPHGLNEGHRDGLFQDSVCRCSQGALFVFPCLTAATEK